MRGFERAGEDALDEHLEAARELAVEDPAFADEVPALEETVTEAADHLESSFEAASRAPGAGWRAAAEA